MKNKILCWGIITTVLGILIILIVNISIKLILKELNYAVEVQKIMSDNFEIEKKWLIDIENIPYDLSDKRVSKVLKLLVLFCLLKLAQNKMKHII